MNTHPSPEHIADRRVNIGTVERAASAVAGSALVALGLGLRSKRGLALAATGGLMVYRGVGGQCMLYRALGIDRGAHPGESVSNFGVKIEREMQFDESPQTLYTFWRDLRNLPTIMPHLEAIQIISDRQSHWRVKGPVGTAIEWDAEVTDDKDKELIAWRTLPGTRAEHIGSVSFQPRPGGGTLVRVALQYRAPGGEVTHTIARFLGQDPGAWIEADLARLKDALGRAQEDRDGLQPASAEALGYYSR